MGLVKVQPHGRDSPPVAHQQDAILRVRVVDRERPLPGDAGQELCHQVAVNGTLPEPAWPDAGPYEPVAVALGASDGFRHRRPPQALRTGRHPDGLTQEVLQLADGALPAGAVRLFGLENLPEHLDHLFRDCREQRVAASSLRKTATLPSDTADQATPSSKSRCGMRSQFRGRLVNSPGSASRTSQSARLTNGHAPFPGVSFINPSLLS